MWHHPQAKFPHVLLLHIIVISLPTYDLGISFQTYFDIVSVSKLGRSTAWVSKPSNDECLHKSLPWEGSKNWLRVTWPHDWGNSTILCSNRASCRAMDLRETVQRGQFHLLNNYYMKLLFCLFDSRLPGGGGPIPLLLYIPCGLLLVIFRIFFGLQLLLMLTVLPKGSIIRRWETMSLYSCS